MCPPSSGGKSVPASAVAPATASAAADVVARAGADAFFRLRSHSIAFHARKQDTNRARKIKAPQKSVSMSKASTVAGCGADGSASTAYVSDGRRCAIGRQACPGQSGCHDYYAPTGQVTDERVFEYPVFVRNRRCGPPPWGPEADGPNQALV